MPAKQEEKPQKDDLTTITDAMMWTGIFYHLFLFNYS